MTIKICTSRYGEKEELERSRDRTIRQTGEHLDRAQVESAKQASSASISLNDLHGQSFCGKWRLRISDLAAVDQSRQSRWAFLQGVG